MWKQAVNIPFIVIFRNYCKLYIFPDISDKIIQQVDKYTSILHEYQEVVATIQQLKKSDEMKDRFCELCEKAADYVLDFRRRGADKEGMVALLQYICVQLTDYDEESCWGHVYINIVKKVGLIR